MFQKCCCLPSAEGDRRWPDCEVRDRLSVDVWHGWQDPWRHFRLTRQQYEVLNAKLTEMGPEVDTGLGGATRITQNLKTLICLWYMADQNSFRELDDKFNVAQSTAHDVIIQVLTAICHMAPAYIKWPSRCDKHICAGVFARWTHPLLRAY